MSESFLSLIPLEPTFRPSLKAAEEAIALLREFLPAADRVDFAFSEHTQLHYPVENWSGVKCPLCGADLDSWWEGAVDAAWESKFADLEVTTPCCVQKVSLNNLKLCLASRLFTVRA